MFDQDLVNNPSTALTVGTSAAKTFSLATLPSVGRSIRSVAAVALSRPETIEVGHSQRVINGLRFIDNKQTAPDVIIDSHLIRYDRHLPLTGISDPQRRVRYGARLVLEAPRAGADSPSTQDYMDALLRLVVMVNPSSNAGLIRLLNGEL